MLNFVAIGNSHLQDLYEGYSYLKEDELHNIKAAGFIELFDPKYSPIILSTENGVKFNEILEGDILSMKDRFSPDFFITSILGAEHLVWSVQGNARKFDVILPFATHLPRIPDTEIVPYRALYQMAWDGLASYLVFNKRLSEITSKPVLQILPPPPVSQEAVFQNAPELLKSIMVDSGTPSLAIRQKMWLLWVHVAEELAAQFGVDLVRTPDDAVDEDGQLKPEFARDAVHGNGVLGMMVWRQIDDLFCDRS